MAHAALGGVGQIAAVGPGVGRVGASAGDSGRTRGKHASTDVNDHNVRRGQPRVVARRVRKGLARGRGRTRHEGEGLALAPAVKIIA